MRMLLFTFFKDPLIIDKSVFHQFRINSTRDKHRFALIHYPISIFFQIQKNNPEMNVFPGNKKGNRNKEKEENKIERKNKQNQKLK